MGLNKNITIKFKNSFEDKCFRLITDAYNSAIDDKTIQLDWDENDITSELHDYINVNSLRIKWKISTNVEHHLPKDTIKKEKGFASKLPRIDLRLSAFSSTLEYKYFLEMKRLKEKGSSLKRRYINTGINNFTSKKYENGSLVGYLVEGDLDKTISGINSLLKRDKRNSEFLIKEVITIHNNYYESNHKEIGKLKHLMFDFTNN